MGIYIPEGADMRRAGVDYDPDQEPVTVNGGSPLVDPLALDPCTDKKVAAERVAQHIEFARQDPDTWVLQWHAAAIEIHPYTITEKVFYRLWMEYYPGNGDFHNEAAYQDFITDVQHGLKEVAGGGADVQP